MLKAIRSIAEFTRLILLYRFARRLWWTLVSHNRWKALVSEGHHIRLHLGAGQNVLPGWFNVDILPFRAPGLYYLDATKQFPFPDSSIAQIFSEHMIEHISRSAAESMLRECNRVLAPEGLIRVATPDLEVLAKLYTEPQSSPQRRYVAEVIDRYKSGPSYLTGYAVNQLFKFDHQFLYDFWTLKELLETAGFTEVVRAQPGASDHPPFRKIDFHADDYIAFESLILEGKKVCLERSRLPRFAQTNRAADSGT
jgi:predicted SAM-dependent methyltransferase